MAHFVLTDRGYVNLDHVARIASTAQGDTAFFNAKDEVVARTGASPEEVVAQAEPVVPAAPNTKGYRISDWALRAAASVG